MKYFIKLNLVSLLYGIMILIPLELIANVYRIARLTNWEIDTVIMVMGIILLMEVIGGTTLLYYLTKNWLGGRKATIGR